MLNFDPTKLAVPMPAIISIPVQTGNYIPYQKPDPQSASSLDESLEDDLLPVDAEPFDRETFRILRGGH